MEKGTLKDKAYAIIKEKIINCEYFPGEVLSESRLLEEIGSSRTPIREALNKLEQEKLVSIMPKRGILVKEVTMELVNSIYEARCLVEPYLVLHYGNRIPKAVLLEVKAETEKWRGFTGLDDLKEVEAGFDAHLHQLFLTANDNPYFEEMMDKVNDQNHRLRTLSTVSVKNRDQETKQEHLKIIEFLLDGDFLRAAEEMQKHLEKSKEAAIQAMADSRFYSSHK